MRRTWLAVLLLALGCKETAQKVHRVELHKVKGDLVELIPLEGTPPHCLAFSISQSGVVRQLTMNEDNLSADCAPGRPIGNGEPFRIPAREGKVRIYVLFSDQKLEAQPIADQIHEFASKPDLTVLDLRAPGRVVTDMIEFVPDAAR
jgi:hypothetical protein